ncbi:MAG: serine acetyltransferase [Clostridiales bacterium]|jgi:serine O-acetyltransferase|nr:serine acetyltransferase [Clostridiales bacterium]MBD9139584.1 serine acetyltransferase [Clostridiales bacterium]
MMSENHICAAAKAMAQTYTTGSVPLYGKKLRLPDRQAVILLIKDIRRLIFPAYYGEAALMSLAPEDYAALLLERIEKQLFRQIALTLPEEQEDRAAELAAEMVTRLPKIARMVQLDLEATFDGDPAAGSREEILFSYPGLFAILVYRVAHELYEMNIPILPRMMAEYAHSHTGIDIHPGAQIGDHFFIDHGTGIVVGETTIIGDRVKLYQGVTLGALSTRDGHHSQPGKRHPTVEDDVTIYSGATILGGNTTIGRGSVVGGNAFLTSSVQKDTRVVIHAPETVFKSRKGEQ